jgi:DNA polymerase III alpha subunit
MAAFLGREPESRKEQAINVAKSFGFTVKPMDVNASGVTWNVLEDGKTLVQPLTSIKGLGEKAVEQIINNRPFNTIEEFLFDENISYSKLNKRAIDVLVRSQALNCLMDNRFSGLKHFWSAVAVDRPRKLKNLEENIEKYAPEGDFTQEEKIEFLTTLTGVFPMSMVVGDSLLQQFAQKGIPPLSEYDPDLPISWFIPRKVVKRKTKNGKDYWVVDVIDSTNRLTKIRCWGVKKTDTVFINRPYMAKLNYNQQWGFSTHSVRYSFKLVG